MVGLLDLRGRAFAGVVGLMFEEDRPDVAWIIGDSLFVERWEVDDDVLYPIGKMRYRTKLEALCAAQKEALRRADLLTDAIRLERRRIVED